MTGKLGYYESTLTAAARWGVTTRRVRVLCATGRIPGVLHVGRDWLLPAGTARPEDRRKGNNMTARYAIIDRYDGGIGETVVSRHKTLVAALRKQRALQARVNRANPNALSKYSVTGEYSAEEYWAASDEVDQD